MLPKRFCMVVAILGSTAACYAAIAQLILCGISPQAARDLNFVVLASCVVIARIIYVTNKKRLELLGWSVARGKEGLRLVFLILIGLFGTIWFASSFSVKAGHTFRSDSPPLLTARDEYVLFQGARKITVDRLTFLTVGGSQIGLNWAGSLFVVSLIVRMGLDLGLAVPDKSKSVNNRGNHR